MTTQPLAPAPAGVEAAVRSCVDRHRDAEGPLLPVLLDLVAAYGYLPAECVPLVARELNVSRADVHGVASFYRDLRTTPPGRTVVRVCRAEACQAVGADAVVAAAELRTGLSLGETAADGSVTLDDVFCLGNCALGPSVEVDGVLHGRVDPERMADLLADSGGGS